MSNLQKFNTTLEDFDKEVGKLKAVSDAYQKLETLTYSYDEISNHFKQNNQKLENINQHIDISLTTIERFAGENKEFYLDLENKIQVKLNDYKSEILQLIEAERLKSIYEISNHFNQNNQNLENINQQIDNSLTSIERYK